LDLSSNQITRYFKPFLLGWRKEGRKEGRKILEGRLRKGRKVMD
jgi:hypothetical protein